VGSSVHERSHAEWRLGYQPEQAGASDWRLLSGQTEPAAWWPEEFR
jgi:hypothetical protein